MIVVLMLAAAAFIAWPTRLPSDPLQRVKPLSGFVSPVQKSSSTKPVKAKAPKKVPAKAPSRAKKAKSDE